MREQILLIALATVILATLVVTVWPPYAVPDRFPHSSSLVVSLVARTNGTVILGVKNRGNQQFMTSSDLIVEYGDSAHPFDYHPGYIHMFTNNQFLVSPGATFQVCLPAPTNHFGWRANIGVVGQRQIAVKTALRRVWPFKHLPAALYIRYEYGQSEWIAP